MPLDASIFASGLPQPNAALPFLQPAAATNAAAPMASAASPVPAGSPVPVPPSLVPIYARESGGNFQAQNPTSTASGAGQDIDATWREAMRALGYGDKYPTAKSAPPEIQNAANIWLQGRYGNKPWAASEPGAAGNLGAMGEEVRAAYDKAAETMHQQAAETRSMLSKLSPDDPELNKQIRDALGKSNEATDELLQMMKKPPQPPGPMDAMAKLGSPAAIIGILAGFLGRRPAIDSFSAAAAAISAGNQGDWQQFKVAHDTWKDQMQTLIQVSELQQQRLRNILEDRNTAMNEKLAVAGEFLRASGMDSQAEMLRAQGVDAVMKASIALSEKTQQMQNQVNSKWGVALDFENKDPQGNPTPYSYNSATGQALNLTHTAPYEPGGYTKANAQPPASFTPQDVDYWASVLKAGGTLPPGLARTAGGSQFVQQLMKRMGEDGADPNQFIANVSQVKADQHSLLNMTKMADAATSFERTARENFEYALSLAPEGIPTNWGPWLNKWVETAETGAGNPDVPAYVTALLTAATEYAKIMSGSTGAQGSTVDSRREAAQLFSPYLNSGQIQAVVKVAEGDMDRRKQSLYGQVGDIRGRIEASGKGGVAPGPGAAAPTATDAQGNKVMWDGANWVPYKP